MICGPSPIELDSWLVIPSAVRLMLPSINEKSLWPVRECWVTPFSINKSFRDDLLVWKISESG
jgi:hypothetical protein